MIRRVIYRLYCNNSASNACDKKAKLFRRCDDDKVTNRRAELAGRAQQGCVEGMR